MLRVLSRNGSREVRPRPRADDRSRVGRDRRAGISFQAGTLGGRMSAVTNLELKRHAKQLMDFYPCSDRWYCYYDPAHMLPPDEKGKIKPGPEPEYGYKDEKIKPVTIELWEQHLLGTQALVLALACRDGTTRVTVVDVDIYGGVNCAEI